MSLPEEDNCAVRADGTLKEASEIKWLHSPSDETRELPPDEPGPFESTREATQEATPPPAPPQREAGKRQIKLSNKLQQQPTLERFVIAGNRTVISSSSRTNAVGSTSNSRTKSVSVKNQTTRTRLTTQAAAKVSVSGTKRPAPKDSEIESEVQKRLKHSRTATTTTFARNEHSDEDNGPQTFSEDDGDLYD
ncbi:hypothetical protein F5887DRAFT_1072806 [Amanita rubescens]|nr:hypothetical protein F5887DRAFT_1072806 [Amanita rubescens]